MKRRNILRSVAMSQPQPEPLANAPLGLRRRKYFGTVRSNQLSVENMWL